MAVYIKIQKNRIFHSLVLKIQIFSFVENIIPSQILNLNVIVFVFFFLEFYSTFNIGSYHYVPPLFTDWNEPKKFLTLNDFMGVFSACLFFGREVQE